MSKSEQLESAPVRRRRLQLSLRGLLVLVSVVGVAFGFGGVAFRNNQLDQDFEARTKQAVYKDVDPMHLLQGGKRRFCSSCVVDASEISVLSQAPNVRTISVRGRFETDQSIALENIASVGQRKIDKLELALVAIKGSAVAKQLGKTFQADTMILLNCDLTADSLSNLVRESSVQHLEILVSEIDDAVFHAIASQPSMKSLSVHGLQQSKPPPGWLAGVPDLEQLVLHDFSLDASACQEISALKNLRHLSLSNTKFDDSLIDKMAALKQLQHLSLSTTNFDDSMIDAVAELRSLQFLDVTRTRISDNGADRIEAFSDIKVKEVGSTIPDRKAYRITADEKHFDQKVPIPHYGATILKDGTYLLASTLFNCKNPSTERRLHFLNSRSLSRQCLSRDGDHIAVQHRGASDVTIYQISTEKAVSVIPNATLRFDLFRLRRNLFCGGRILIQSGQGFQVWDVARQTRLASIPNRKDGSNFEPVEISPDGSQLLVAKDPRRRDRSWAILDCDSGETIREFPGKWAHFNSLSEPYVSTRIPNHSGNAYHVTNLATKNVTKLHCNWKSESSNQARGLIFSRSGNRVLVYDAKLHARVYDLTPPRAKLLYSTQLPDAFVDFINDDELVVGEPKR